MTIVNPLLKFVCSQCQTRILVEELEKIFLRDLEAFVTIHGAAVTALMSVDIRDEDHFRERRQVTEEQEKLEKEIAKVQQQVLDGKVNSAKFSALLKPLELQRKALRSKVKKLEVQSSQKNDGEAGAQPAPASSLDFVTKVWPQLPLKFQQKITRSFVERYVISPGRVLIHHHFPLETDTTDQQIADPTNDPPEPIPGEPVYIRLPKAGTLCPLSGLTRAML